MVHSVSLIVEGINLGVEVGLVAAAIAGHLDEGGIRLTKFDHVLLHRRDLALSYPRLAHLLLGSRLGPFVA